MCGLVGYIGVKPFDKDKINILMLYNMSRGGDSTGYYTEKEGVVKNTDNAMDFLGNKKLIADTIFIGHCRKTSMGNICKDNAHPFEIENIVGAHNGHVRNWQNLFQEEELRYYNINIDSAAIMFGLAKHGDPRVLYRLNGAAALIFTDKRQKCLYVYRNEERPLFSGRIGDGMYMSSMENSLYAIGCSRIKFINAGVLHKINDTLKIEKFPISLTLPQSCKQIRINSDLVGVTGEYKNVTIAKSGELVEMRRGKANKIKEFKSSITGTWFTIEDRFIDMSSFQVNPPLKETPRETNVVETAVVEENAEPELEDIWLWGEEVKEKMEIASEEITTSDKDVYSKEEVVEIINSFKEQLFIE